VSAALHSRSGGGRSRRGAAGKPRARILRGAKGAGAGARGLVRPSGGRRHPATLTWASRRGKCGGESHSRAHEDACALLLARLAIPPAPCTVRVGWATSLAPLGGAAAAAAAAAGRLPFPCIARAEAGGRSAPDTPLPPRRWRHFLSRAARRARPCWPRFSLPRRSRRLRRRRPPPFPAPCCRPRSRRRRPRKPRGLPLQAPSSRPTLRAPRARPSCRSRRLARSRSRPTAAATCRPAGLWWRLGTTAR